MQTIDSEARSRVRHPLDFDNMAEKYKTPNEYFTFTSPSLWVLEKHLFYLLQNSIQKDFENKYKWRPSYLSYDEYGTVVLEPYLMYVNGVMSIEDFDLVKVIIPDKDALINIARDKIIVKPEDLGEVDW